MAIVYQHQVRYHETDAQSYLFNARYLELADVAMTEFMRHIGCPYPDVVEQGFDASVVKATIEFRRPARFDDVLDVDVRCTRVGTSSFGMSFAMTRENDTIAVVESVYVNVDTATEKSRPIPAAVATALSAAVPAEA